MTAPGCTADDAEFACECCTEPMLRPFVLDVDEAALCETCAGFMCSLGCGRVCLPKDRLPFLVGVVHSGCALKLTNAMGYERAAVLIRRSGPLFDGARAAAARRVGS